MSSTSSSPNQKHASSHLLSQPSVSYDSTPQNGATYYQSTDDIASQDLSLHSVGEEESYGEIGVSEGFTQNTRKSVTWDLNGTEAAPDTDETPLFEVEPGVMASYVKRTANIPSSIFNLSNAALGAGILAFPFAFKSAGLLLGLVITTCMVAFAAFTLHVVAYVAHHHNCNSYQEVVSVMLGKRVQFLSECILLLYLLGACVVYLTVVGNCSHAPIKYYASMLLDNSDVFFTDRRFIITVLSLIFVFPLCLLKQINKLAFSSVLACAGGLYLVIFVILEASIHFAREGISDSVILFANTSLRGGILPEIFMAFPLIAFAFHCHVQLPPIYAELKNPSMVRADVVIGSSLSLCNLFYVLVGVFGYLRFGHGTLDDVLLGYDHDSLTANFGRLAIAITAVFSYPLNFFTVRLTIQSLFFRSRVFTNWMHYTVVTVGFIFTLLVALFVPGVGVVFGICGAMGACSLMFLFPGMIIFVAGYKTPNLKWVFVPLSFFYMGLGILLAVCGVSVTLLQLLYTEEF